MCTKHDNKLFESSFKFCEGDVDILMISEKKIDESFPLDQVEINCSNTPVRLDRNSSSRRVMCPLLGKMYRQI